jgi:hypothetical protein
MWEAGAMKLAPMKGKVLNDHDRMATRRRRYDRIAARSDIVLILG